MTLSKNTGTCFLCRQTIAHRASLKHLVACAEKNVTVLPYEKSRVFLLKIVSGPSFWMYLDINGEMTLADLDNFLRNLWLECCGHMSRFDIHGEKYTSDEAMD